MLPPDPHAPKRIDHFTQVIGRSRFIVLIAVIAVMLVAVCFFLFGALQALVGIWHAWEDIRRGDLRSTQITVEFLEIVSVMLKAVVFYIIGVGLYSLFISPLNITVSLGVKTLNDLESKVVSVVVVILGITFLEHFIGWQDPLATLQFGAAMALVIASLVLFQHYTHQVKEKHQAQTPHEQVRAQKHMFEEADEQAELEPKDDDTSRN